MIALGTLLRSVTTVAILAALAACSGAGAPPASSGTSTGASSLGHFAGPDSCRKHDGVGVKPCMVTLTTTNPTQVVTVTSPNGSTVTVRDAHCAKKDIATVSGAGSAWDVTAGTTAKSCIAMFIAKDAKGHNIGRATLYITNNV